MATSSSAEAEFGSLHIARGIGRLSSHVLSRGEGSWVYTDAGVKLLDLTMGIGVVGCGHCHPVITEAAVKQMGMIQHAQVNIAFSAPYIAFVRALLPKLALADPSLDTVFLWNSGAEAVEASIKLARSATGRQNVVVMQGSYHGRTMLTAGMTRSKTVYGATFHPLVPGIYSTPFPFYAQHGVGPEVSEEFLVQQSLHQLHLLLAQQTAPRDTAAIILEPVLGEGGYVPCPSSFLQGLRKVCDAHGILLIVDEVQSGTGRTGTWWACEPSGVRPDVLVFAKGIANGLPLSGIASRKELFDKQDPGSMGGTYAGNAVACAAGKAVIEVMDNEKVLDNVAARSEQLFTFLRSLRSTPAGSLIQDIRGRGLMVGVQFVLPSVLKSINASSSCPATGAAPANGAAAADETSKAVNAGSQNAAAAETRPHEVGITPRPQVAPRIVKKCLEKGMLLLATSVFDVLRFIPALTISEAEMQTACEIFESALQEVWEEVKEM